MYLHNSNFFHGIMFHHFHDDKLHLKGQGSISSKELNDLIKFIGINNILDPYTFYDLCAKGKLKNNHLCLTFDDGIKCQIDVALPVLEDLKIKAFFFVYTSIFTGKPDLLEVYRFFRINYFKDIQEFYDFFFKLIGKNLNNFFKEKSEEIAKWKKFYPFYTLEDIKFRLVRDQYLTKIQYNNIFSEIFEKKQFKAEDHFKNLFFDKNDLLKLKKLGHTIGLHTHNHPTLLESLEAEDQHEEYFLNHQLLNKLLSFDRNEIFSVSHPLGSYSSKTLEILKNLDIKLGFRDNMFIDEKKMSKINNSNLEVARQDHSNIMAMLK